MRKCLLFLFLLTGYTLCAQNKSNRGTEFWVGYGHNALFGNVNGGFNTQEMVLYLGANQAATVTVSVNGTAYSQTYNIPANSVIQTATIPKAGANDARLTAEGLSTKGIHIVSDVPIVAYAHQYGLNSSGATMLMPVETYGYTYYSLNYTQVTNVDPSYSWFYVVASENNTRVEITPSVATQGGKPAGTAFTVTMNKGEIYNVFGQSATGSFAGNDVTGSKAQSIAGTDGKCHPIAVFSGSSRITICGGSGDILQQQIFPSSAWGTNYLTFPTISTNNNSQPNLNYYRIAVRDPSTKVKKNGVLLTGLINNFYYQYSSTNGDFIEANKPVLVSQYVPSMQGCGAYDGNGDPEMFFLSPLQQAVDQASFYSTNNQNIFDNFVSIIIKNTGIPSLLVDGAAAFNAVIPHPQNPLYSVVIQSLLGNQQHTMSSDSVFTAITYGFGSVESYGYNAGTLINNLDIIPSIKNVLSSGTKPSATACPNSPFSIIVSMAYKATKAVWHFSQVSNLTPGYDTTFINPVPFDSVVLDGRTYYRYKLPNTYILTDTGTYNIPISITAPEIDNCNNTLDFIYSVRVNPIPKPGISVNYSTCQQDTARFLTTGISGFPIQNFIWTFDDGTNSFITNPFKTFPVIGPHLVKLRVITYDGCISDTSTIATTNAKPTATFGIAPLPACEGSTLTFSDTSFFGGPLVQWFWDFGNGQTRTVFNTNSQTSSYPAPGLYTIKHMVKSSGSCGSDTAKKVIQIFAKPQTKFKALDGCLADSTVRFTDSTKISDGQLLNYLWSFGDPNANAGNPNASTIKNPLHKYIVSGKYKVTLTVTTANGCSSVYSDSVTVNPPPVVNFNINAPAQCITANSFTFTNTSSIAGGSITYSWNFGDGGNSTVTSPLHAYAAAGTYNVRLIATSDKGCKDTAIKSIVVNPKPVALFAINVPSQCITANNFGFINNSTLTSGTMTYSWSFGDGAVSSILSPTHSYGAAGVYAVKLIVTSDKGCKDSITKSITVNPKPVAAFTINTVTQCFFGNSFAFTNTSTVSSGSLTYNWFFGDGALSTLLSPTHSYVAAGTYTVKLVVTSNNGCKDSVSKTVTVLTKPVASFSINDSSQCTVANNFIFTNASTTSVGTLSYLWAFGDGATSLATSPTHSYAAAGNYTVKLVVTSSNGCKDSISKIVVVNPKPTALFNIVNAAQCLTGNSFSLINTSSVTLGTLSYQWSFGDGGTAATQNATHSYTSAGTYFVKLIVTSNNGCKDSITKPLVVNPGPTVAYNVNSLAQCVTGNNFTFTNATTIPTGTLTYQWFFGDGGTAVTQNAVHTYASAGSYNVKLVATGSTGCKDSLTKTVIVGPKPVASFNINNTAQCVSTNNFIFTSTSSIATGSITYQWSFGDGGTSVLQNPLHSYTTAGTYTVRLITISDKGCVDTINKTVTVNPKPTASYTINNASQCLIGNSFVFTNASTVLAGTLTYQWFFGDGGTSTLISPTHAYAAAGTYTVRLVATSINGCTDTATRSLTVNPKPFVSFVANDPSQCLSGNSFSFTNSSSVSTGTITYLWAFGDGGTSTLQNPTHSYTATGVYTIKLIVTSDKGCKDSTIKTVSVNPKPAPAFTINNPGQCFAGNSFTFTNTTPNTLGTLSYTWNFGDGATTNAASPAHSYSAPGTYIVKLLAVAGNGCKDSITQTVTVSPKPVAAFTINAASQCFKANSVVFTNTSSVATGTMTYQWSFGDGGNATSQNASHTYLTAGTYTVKLVVTSDKGCKDSIAKAVIVFPSPTAAFNINNVAQCLVANNFVFTNTTTISSGSLSYQWSFGDGGVSSAVNASHVYLSAGNYNIKLLVISNNGCRDSIVKSITVNPQPAVGFNIISSGQCVNANSFKFNNTSTVSSGTITYQWTFGDGGSSTLQSPAHIYTASGSFPVKLVVTTNNGCKDSMTGNAIVYPKPAPLFTINSAAQCVSNNVFAFTNTSSIASGTMIYLWKFGDGLTSVLTNPTHVYAAYGNYTVMLVAISNNGCRDSVTRVITVNPRPVASFNINTQSQCLRNNSFVFTNTSTIATGTNTYEWTFGDGGISVAQNSSHTYMSAGNYTVRLIAISGSGCKDTINKVVTVYPMPASSFTVNNVVQCQLNNSFVFTNNSTVVAPASYLWLFGDGNTSTLPSSSYTYTSSGSYSVSIIVTSASGCKDTAIKRITVYPMPTASFNVSLTTQCLANNSVTFSNTSTISSGSLLFQWYFGDGSAANTISPVHTYTAAGTYTVKLIVTTGFGCKDSTTRTVVINPQPTASFNISNASQCFAANKFTFTNTSSIPGTATYNWSFGDGSTSILFGPSYTYAVPGSYTVRLIVTTPNGCIDSISKQVVIYPQPVAAFSANSPIQCFAGNNFVFANGSSISSGSISYSWSFGDGGLSTATNPGHAYVAVGAYNVKLLVVSGFGCADSTGQSVKVNPQPIAVFSINDTNQCFNGQNFVFSNKSTSTGTPVYQWAFGDGGVSALMNPSHAYPVAGIYTVKLLVTSGSGCKDSTTEQVVVFPKPTASFNITTATAQCLNGNSFTFANNSSVSSGSLSAVWYFGDGVTSTAISPSHIYAATGTYIVKLVITSNNGCKDSTSTVVSVNPKPQVAFAVSTPGQCLTGNTFSFINNSVSAGFTIYQWTFGDGTSSGAQNPLHIYTTDGIYVVKLVVVSGSGCKDSTSQTIAVFPKPTAAFSANTNAQCFETNSFIFNNTSTVSSGTYTSQWSFGDGTFSTVNNPVHVYATSGTFTIKLVVTTNDGCRDSTIRNVLVNPKPKAAFNINDSTQCLDGNIFRFSNTSVVVGAGTYFWSFGDAATTGSVSPSHVYGSAGTYDVKLIAYSVAGCKDSVTRQVTAFPKVTAGFGVSLPVQCFRGNNFIYTNTSSVTPGTLTMAWSFGDGVLSSQTNPVHQYSTSGTFNIKLLVTSDNGCTDTATTQVIVNQMPNSVFNNSNPLQCLKGNNFIFSNGSTGPPPLKYRWAFGDGIVDSLTASPAYHYNISGVYPVTLISTTANGCADTTVKPVTVHPQPIASFNVVTSGDCANNNNYSFANTSTINGGTMSHSWTFGDGGTSNLASPVHSYNAGGTFPVMLIEVSDKGCRDSADKPVIVKALPVVGFAINNPNQCINTNRYTFTNSSAGASPVKYLWTLGDGVVDSTISAVHTYTSEGAYRVTLSVSANGCIDSISKQVIVYPKPLAAFAISQAVQCLVGNAFAFTNAATISSGTLQYQWAFGDGSTSTVASPIHTYTRADTFAVRQIVTSNFGCIDSTKQLVQVLVNPRAVFGVNNSNQCLIGNNFIFTNNSVAPAGTTYSWSFGDGTASNTASPSKVYRTASAYKVTLYLTANSGCKSDTATTSVSVIPNPVVNAGPDLIVAEGKTVMLNASATYGLSFKWTPGTYLSSVDVQTPLTTPRQNIGYRLTATGTNGCTGYDSVYVRILKPFNIPNVFSPNGDGVNDTWVLRFISDYPGCTVEVFNRYGAPVYTSTGYKIPWDGTRNGTPLPVGTYYYVIDPKNGIDKVAGNVTILR